MKLTELRKLAETKGYNLNAANRVYPSDKVSPKSHKPVYTLTLIGGSGWICKRGTNAEVSAYLKTMEV